MYSTGVPHALHGGFTFSLPPQFSSPLPDNGGDSNQKSQHCLWEEITVRPDVSDELKVHNVLPHEWNDELSNHSRYATLTPLQTTGSGDCLLNALSLGMYGVQDRTQSLAIDDVVLVNVGENTPPMKCRIVEVTADGSAVGVLPIHPLSNEGAFTQLSGMDCDNNSQEPMVVPCSSIIGEADTDSVDYKLLQEGGLFAPSTLHDSHNHQNGFLSLSKYHSGVILSREWASLRLLLSCTMRESGDVLFPRWARDRVADTNEQPLEEDLLLLSPITEEKKETVVNMTAENKYSESDMHDDEKENQQEDKQQESMNLFHGESIPPQRVDSEMITAAAMEEGFITAQRLRDDWFESLDDAGTPKRSLLPEHVW